MGSIDALIFDFDGLIVDTESAGFESWRRIYAEYGHELSLERWQGAIGSQHGFDALEHLYSLTGGAFDRAAMRQRREQLKAELSAPQPLLPGVRAILAEAAVLGLPRAIASSSNRAWVVGWLRHHAIEGSFQCIRTAEDVPVTKPAPDLFLAAASCLKVEPARCLVFEDSANGILAARAAGMRCVAVPGPLTRHLALPRADLLLASLDALPLREILAAVAPAS